MRNNHKDICIVISQARSSGRGLLQGVLRFAESRPDWKVHIYEPNAYGFSETVRALREKTTDGVLTAELENQDFARQLERSTVPLVVIGTRRQCLPARTTNLTVISFDEKKIGSYAAQQALDLGLFKSFGFVGSTDAKHIALSELRAAGFRDELRNRQPLDFRRQLEHLVRIAALAPKRDEHVFTFKRAGKNAERCLLLLH